MIGSSIVSSPEDGLDKLAKQARAVLVVIAVVHLISAGILYMAGGIADLVTLAIALSPGLLFVGLAVWARKDPLTAVLVGLGIWIVITAVAAIIDPATLWSGWIFKAIVIALFVSGISTAKTFNRLKLTVAKKA